MVITRPRWLHNQPGTKAREITYRYRENETRIGLHIAFLYTPEAVANNEPARNLEEALKYSTYNTEGWRVRNKGEKFWADVHYTPLYDDDRHLLGYAKVTREVSNRKIAGAKDKKLKDKKQNLFTGNISFRKLIENSYEGITLLDKDLNIIYRSSSAERINGWDTADRLNEDIIKLVHPDDKGARWGFAGARCWPNRLCRKPALSGQSISTADTSGWKVFTPIF